MKLARRRKSRWAERPSLEGARGLDYPRSRSRRCARREPLCPHAGGFRTSELPYFVTVERRGVSPLKTKLLGRAPDRAARISGAASSGLSPATALGLAPTIRRAVTRGVLAVISLSVALSSCGGSDESSPLRARRVRSRRRSAPPHPRGPRTPASRRGTPPPTLGRGVVAPRVPRARAPGAGAAGTRASASPSPTEGWQRVRGRPLG